VDVLSSEHKDLLKQLTIDFPMMKEKQEKIVS